MNTETFTKTLTDLSSLPASSDEEQKPAVVKRPRGRPAKYKPEEREQKYKEASVKWQKEHKEEYKEYQKNYYNDHNDILNKQSTEYVARARNALRLLTEMVESGEFDTSKYRDMANDLVKNKKIIYT